MAVVLHGHGTEISALEALYFTLATVQSTGTDTNPILIMFKDTPRRDSRLTSRHTNLEPNRILIIFRRDEEEKGVDNKLLVQLNIRYSS